MLDRILYWAGGVELVVGGLIQLYPAIFPEDFGFYLSWFMIALGTATIAAGFLVQKKRRASAVSDESKSLFNQSIKVDGTGNTITQTNNNNVTFGVTPRFELIQEPTFEANSDGTFTARYVAKMSAPGSRLTVQARGSGLISLDIGRPKIGYASSVHKSEVRKSTGGDYLTESFGSPSGTYEIAVKTSAGQLPKIGHEIEP